MSREPLLTPRQIIRRNLLADVANLYFVERKTQREIADKLGATRSNVSRMLSDAVAKGIVKITILRPSTTDAELEERLCLRFSLAKARVVIVGSDDESLVRKSIASVAAQQLREVLCANCQVGITWGRALKAMVDEFVDPPRVEGCVVQLAGSFGAKSAAFDSVELVQRLSRLLQAKPVYLSAPFIVETAEIAQSLKRNASNRVSIDLGKQCDVIVAGIGSAELKDSTLYKGGHITRGEAREIQKANAVGDICGHPFDIDGRPVAKDFRNRLIGLSIQDLRKTPIRLSVVGGMNKRKALWGALKGKLITHLVTDDLTAESLLTMH